MKPLNDHGFTLIEMSVSAAVLLIAIAMGMAGFTYVLRSSRMAMKQDELDVEVQSAMERLKRDLRLSSLDCFFYYPDGIGPYTAISFPMARDDDSDGAIELDADGKIIWDVTYVYHVWSSAPNQLRLTVFDSRDNGLTDAQRQEQLEEVVTGGGGASTHNGSNASTEVVFENLFDWSIHPESAVYDGYNASTTRDVRVSLGAVALTNGNHVFEWKVIGKNSSSSGYKIGVDNVTVSPSYGSREAEAQLPVAAQTTGIDATNLYMGGGSWNGNYHLYFPAVSTGQYFQLSLDNDRWEETNFKGTGQQRDNTIVEFDQAMAPADYVLRLAGNTYSWWADEQSGDALNGVIPDLVRGCAIRVLLRGDEMMKGGWIKYDGARCKVRFKAGQVVSEKLGIDAAYIAECAGTETNSPDIVPGTSHQLTFGGSPTVTIPGGSMWSDPADFAIDKDKSYIVSYLIGDAASLGHPWRWQGEPSVDLQGCFLIEATNNPTVSDLTNGTWSARSDVISMLGSIGVECMWTRYPAEGYFVSQVFDTQLSDPTYDDIDWSADVPVGCSLSMKVRSGDSADMSDADPWTNVVALSGPTLIAPGAGRYVQFKAILTPNADFTECPVLKEVTVDWDGEERVVDVGGTFTRGPDYGIFEVTVDGRSLTRGVLVDLEIYNDIAGFAGNTRITSGLAIEVEPRNTGN